MRLLIVVVGKDKNDPLKNVAEDYLLRTNPFLKPYFLYVKEAKRRENISLATEEEGKEILKQTQGFFRIAMDLRGKDLSSTEFTSSLQKLFNNYSKPVAFIIGGATGLAASVLQEADAIWKLSSLTFPHRMAYLILSEQIYRAGEILRGGPYHK